jgi:hypothetical protein
LTSHEITLGTESPIVFQTSTVEGIVASIQKLHAQPNGLRYRSHLEELSSQLFHKLATSNDPDVVIMTLLATTSCHHPLSRTISHKLIRSEHPIIQLAAVQALSALNTSDADYLLIEALRSDYPAVRLEAAWRMATKRSNDAFYHIDALSHKLPEEFLQYLPELYAIEGSAHSLHRLRQLLFNPDDDVVIETLLAIGRHHITGLDDLLGTMAPHSPAITEAFAFALRVADSSQTRLTLHDLTRHDNACVRIQAALSLVFLGETEYQSIINDLAGEGNLFALAALGECLDPIIGVDCSHQTRTARINLALALLNRKDPSDMSQIKSLLATPEDQMLYTSLSIGGSLAYWDIAPVDAFDQSSRPMMMEQALQAKEAILVQACEMRESSFEDIAAALFTEQAVELYPCLLQLIENLRSEPAIALLRQEAHRVGAPFNRAFASLSLIRLGIEEDEAALKATLDFSREREEQSWRPPLPWMTFLHTGETGSQQQASSMAKLYIETVDTLAQRGTPESIRILIDELNCTPRKYLPFIVASLLHATM